MNFHRDDNDRSLVHDFLFEYFYDNYAIGGVVGMCMRGCKKELCNKNHFKMMSDESERVAK